MDVSLVFEGVHPDGIKFRVRFISGMFYYAEQLPDGYGGWLWRTVARNPSKKAIVERVQADRVAKQYRIEYLKERGLI